MSTPQGPTLRAHQNPSEPRETPWRLLLVDDDDIDLMIVERMLEDCSIDTQMVVATSAQEARRAMADEVFDCALVDLELPDGDGISLAREDGAPPTVILTGRDDEGQATRAVREGVQDYLIKGEFDQRHLQRAILYAVERARLRDQLCRVTSELHKTVSNLERANRELERLATIDGLTGLHNRRAFDRKLDTLVKEARRGRRFCLVLLDVDHFKSFNDTYGHQVGDSVLCAIGDWLRGNVREVDFPARYGGEEFGVLLVDIELEMALTLTERFRRGLAHDLPLSHPVTASFGVSAFEAWMHNGQELIEAADQALYRAKHAGRNRVAC
jgi:diguanylate cyclase (GGDEF)-like protein